MVESDSDSSDCSVQENTNYSPINKTKKTVPSVADLLRNSLLHPNMTSFESMTAQLATIASLNGLYPGEHHTLICIVDIGYSSIWDSGGGEEFHKQHKTKRTIRIFFL